ncbi:MAG: hypothetical protein JSV88_30345 [Candidatus Aminicenantes bacterium]|nr:MAG: hypothetical protein JSV88_30345 [Candidatus Aminicenantes bacterium]
MAYKNISAQLSDEDKSQVLQKLKEIESLLPFIVNLSPGERKTIPNMGRKSLKFVESALGYAKKHPNFVPPYMNVDEQQKDLEVTKQLYEILEVLEPLWEKVNDTCFASGAEAYHAARVFYNSVKGAAKAGIPGVDIIARELGKTFERSSSSSSKEQEKKEES